MADEFRRGSAKDTCVPLGAKLNGHGCHVEDEVAEVRQFGRLLQHDLMDGIAFANLVEEIGVKSGVAVFGGLVDQWHWLRLAKSLYYSFLSAKRQELRSHAPARSRWFGRRGDVIHRQVPIRDPPIPTDEVELVSLAVHRRHSGIAQEVKEFVRRYEL